MSAKADRGEAHRGPARAAVLASVRSALADGGPPVPAGRPPPGADVADPVELFAERVAEYRATVRRTEAEGLAVQVAELCAEHQATRIGIPSDLPAEWLPAGVEFVPDDPPLTPRALDALDGSLTGCALAVAETGSLVLDHGPRQGRRALTLLPDLHLCVVAEADVVADVPDALAILGAAVRDGRPVTFVSGPSATSDIELQRVEGVHGPRRLVVLLVAG
ncbi:MAG TPA: lactate utilization protein C [Thermoleophilaceae bacterium]|nr:lactate utilization protein C [Thermoleophilaceae bacterium]